MRNRFGILNSENNLPRMLKLIIDPPKLHAGLAAFVAISILAAGRVRSGGNPSP